MLQVPSTASQHSQMSPKRARGCLESRTTVLTQWSLIRVVTLGRRSMVILHLPGALPLSIPLAVRSSYGMFRMVTGH